MSDDFEQRLQSLTRELQRPNPAAAWKDEILARALARTRKRPPRWLAIPLAASWVAILVLRITTPELPDGALSAPRPLILFAFQNLSANYELP